MSVPSTLPLLLLTLLTAACTRPAADPAPPRGASPPEREASRSGTEAGEAEGAPPDAAPSSASEAPIVFSDPRHDFGVVRDDPEVRVVEGRQVVEGPVHAFRFRVSASAPATITRIVTTCGCTTVEGEGSYPAGTTGEVRVRYDARNRQGRDEKKILVHVAGHPEPIPLVVIAEVDAAFALEPRAHWFGETAAGAQAEPAILEVVARDPEAALRFEGVFLDPALKTPAPFVEIEELGSRLVEVRGTTRRAHRYRATFRGRKEIGRFQTRAVFRPEGEDARPVAALLMGSVVGPVRASPDLVSVQGTPGSPFERTLRFTKRDDEDPVALEILGLTVEGETLPEVAITRATERPMTFRLSGTIPEAATPGANARLQGALRVRTNHPEQPRLTLPFTVYVRGTPH